jgi:hypothetical protein
MNWKQWFWRIVLNHRANSEKTNTEQRVTKKENLEIQEMAKYQHPKILLIDLENSVNTSLKEKGYNISVASLGLPYLVPVSASLFPVYHRPSLSYDYKEQEIVIIDLHYQPKEGGTTDLKEIEVADEVNIWWVRHEKGLVNPRLFSAVLMRDDFDRILNTGGVFVIFANRPEVQEFYWGHRNRHYGFQRENSKKFNSWDFLSLTSSSNYFNVEPDHGSTITLSDELSKDTPISYLLSKYLDNAVFDCTVRPGYQAGKEWISFLTNKFGSSVGGVFMPNENRKGAVFIFPNIQDKAAFILEFIDQVLPSIAPNLFPEIEKVSWIHLPEYELHKVMQFKKRIVEIRERAQSEIDALEDAICQEQEKYSYLYGLLRETGDDLVQAVQTTLTALGFSNVINVDEEIARQGVQKQNREDLQIREPGKTLIIEVKGITNFPTDDDALTVQKYVILRMREWRQVDVQGLTIINHQRHLPPLDRNNEMPFRQEILDVAEEQKIGLMTAWDLHRLARSYIKNEWSHENIRNLFFQPGRVQLVPTHYEYIGTIERYIEKINVIGVKIEVLTVKRRSRIAFELATIFEEQICDTLQYENDDIEEGQVGMLVGIKTHLTKEQAKAGTRVFRVVSKNHAE